eukprot:CAMPEP_0115155298 /NCGR_PEP_ID=MMETSP0227-20121206/67810_1 /TAXON_ID=89957 /ORGANISM="Polarella glacialis, Strain CCMP 1383" /LENGTH=895 /DNA_ID=CAMNT_0002566345 /DNA_START=132 /DNA_END=2816 /DNA_ORIENTATION=+
MDRAKLSKVLSSQSLPSRLETSKVARATTWSTGLKTFWQHGQPGRSSSGSCRIDFNLDFQKAHAGCTPKNHWAEFLQSLGAGADVQCQKCQQVLLIKAVGNVCGSNRCDALCDVDDAARPKIDDDGSRDVSGVAMVADDVDMDKNCAFPNRGRPKKGVAPAFDLMEFLQTERRGMYRILSHAEVETHVPLGLGREDVVFKELQQRLTQCKLCGTLLHLPRASNMIALTRHEESKYHQAALANSKDMPMELELVSCSGIFLATEAVNSPSLSAGAEKFVLKWCLFDCPAIANSRLDMIKARLDADDRPILQSGSCAAESRPILRGRGCCQSCLDIVMKPKKRVWLLAIMKEWCLKIDWILLTHANLQGNGKAQQALATSMSQDHDLLRADLLSMTYPQCLVKTRQLWSHLPRIMQNRAVRTFMEVRLNYLTPQIALGVSPDMKKQVMSYVEAVANGSLSSTEVQITDLISSGALRADEVARLLVPALLSKADKMKRGCTQRTSTSNIDISGLHGLCFALGRSMKNKDVQRVLGLSRAVSKPKLDFLVEWLPQFFLAFGDQLLQSTGSAISLLGAEGSRRYMLVRDETVYARTFSVVQGINRQDPSISCVVGGAHPGHALIQCGPDIDIASRVQEAELAQVTVVTCAKRLDRRTDLFQVQVVPRSRVTTAIEEFSEVGLISAACVASNHGFPPMCYAYDNHKSFSQLDSFLLGVLPLECSRDVEFWKSCVASEKLDLPCWEYRVMKYNGQFALFGCNDPKHVAKASSTRLLPEPVDPVPLAQQALDEVCALKSIATVGGVDKKLLKKELVSWFKTEGHAALFSGAQEHEPHNPDAEEAEADDEEEADLPAGHPEGGAATKSQPHEVVQILELAAAEATMAEEIKTMQAESSFLPELP